ncbi:hypothetical protein GCM10027592_06970 [Spirosoma flavus]
MNKLVKISAFVAAVLLFSIGLISCDKNNLTDPMPQQNGAARTGVNQFDIPPVVSIFKKYTLTKDGNTVLTYSSDGRLIKASLDPNHYIDYGYGFNGSVITKTEHLSGKVTKQEFYTLNNDGKATHSHHKTFNFQGNVETERSYDYEYYTENGLKGNLKKIKSTINNERWDFTYNPNHGIDWINHTDASGVNDENIWHSYGSPTGGLVDKNRLNPTVKPLDTYLKIFGDFDQLHLVPMEHHYKPGSNSPFVSFFYDYTLNADGYPIQRGTKMNTIQVALKFFDYEVTPIGTIPTRQN